MQNPDDRVALFERYRPRLFGIAYRMLGTVDDAEDLVQETYMRWHGADTAGVRTPEAWLVAVISRLAIDRLRSAATARTHYVGEWLPEPIATDERFRPDRKTEMASDLSMAFLVLLERLAPEERAAFLLREVFDTPYDEIAPALEKSEPACRQLVHRAKERVRADRVRFTAPPDAQSRLFHRFLEALEGGDSGALLELFDTDATWVTDSGGKVSAARRMLHGAETIVRFLLGIERKARGRIVHRMATINGEPAMVSMAGERVYAVTSFQTDGERIQAVFRVMNPEKLERLVIARRHEE